MGFGKFKCKVCGKNHQLYSRVELPEPDVLRNALDSNSEGSFKIDEGAYVMNNNRVFLKGLLFLYSNPSEIHPLLQIGVWSSINITEFREKYPLLELGTIAINSILETQIPFLNHSIGMASETYLDSNHDHSIVRIMEESELKNAQENFSKDELVNVMQKVYHNDIIKKIN